MAEQNNNVRYQEVNPVLFLRSNMARSKYGFLVASGLAVGLNQHYAGTDRKQTEAIC